VYEVWVESLLRWGISVGFIVLLILVYERKTNPEEKHVGWKLIGYFFLGTFTFKFETWVLPVGIVVFIFFFLPNLKVNKTSKKRAASLGAASYVFGLLITYSVQAYYEKEIRIQASTNNAYEMNFFEEYEKVKSSIKADEELAIINFDFSFKKDGKIKDFNYTASYLIDGRSMVAWVKLMDGQYEISKHLIQPDDEETQMLMQENTVSTPAVYFKALDLHGLKKMVPETDLHHVNFFNSGSVTSNEEGSTLWYIESTGISRHDADTVSADDPSSQEESFPYHVAISSMKYTGAGTYTADQHRYFTISTELLNE
jgi:hypothetical protein